MLSVIPGSKALGQARTVNVRAAVASIELKIHNRLLLTREAIRGTVGLRDK